MRKYDIDDYIYVYLEQKNNLPKEK